MIRKIFRQMLLTQILSSMTVMICMLIDSMMIGRFLGVDSMTAYGLATPVLLVFAAFGSMLSAGVQVLCGKTVGSGDAEGTNACYTAAAALALGVSLLGTLLVLAFAGPLCTLLGAGRPSPDNPVFTLTRDYLRGFIIGAPAFICAQVMVPFMQIADKRSRLIAAVGLMTLSDAAFDVLNVFVFRGGTFGMGLASSLSYYIAAGVGLVYFFKKDCIFRPRPRAVTGKLCRELLGYGVPTVINQISLVLLVFLLNKILLQVGRNLAVAAYSVISTAGNLCYSFGSGVASVALLLSSVFYCDEDKSAIHTLVRTMVRYAVLLDLIVIAAVLAGAPWLVRLFLAEDPAARELATLGLRLFSLSLLPCALNTGFKNYYQGVNRTRFTELISVMQNFAFPVLFAFLLSRLWGTTGVWLCFLCGESLTFLIISLVVWRRNGKIRFSAAAYSLLPADFGAAEGDCIEMSVSTPEEAAEASRRALEFCRAHGDSEKNSVLISLCVEEMVTNAVKHGFGGDTREHSVDIRILYKDQRRLIRLRDNGVRFDPVRYMELHKEDDPTRSLGIRMVMKMVREANYIHSLGLNNLTLIL